MGTTTTTPPTVPPPGTLGLTPADKAFLKIADHALVVAKAAAASARSAQAQGEQLHDAKLTAALKSYVDAVAAIEQTVAEEHEEAHAAAKIPDPANIRFHAELARDAAERALAEEKKALGIIIQVEMEVLAVASLERDFDPIKRLGLGDIRPVTVRSRPYSDFPRDLHDIDLRLAGQ
jgi:hypothetical protein